MTREERIEAALATVGKTTDGPWTRYDHNNMARFGEDPKDWIGYAWAGFGGEPNGTFQGAVAETDRRKDGCREFKERAEFDFDLITAAPDLRDEVIALRKQVEWQRATINQAQKAMTEMSIALHGDRVHGSSQASQDALPAFSAALSQIESEEAEGCEDCDDGCGCTDGPCFDDDHKEAQT